MNPLAFATLNHSPLVGCDVPLTAQIAAAGVAGFDAVSPDVFSLNAHIQHGGTWAELSDALAAHGMTCVDIAGLTIGADAVRTKREAEELLGVATALGAGWMQARVVAAVDDAVRELTDWCASLYTAAGIGLGLEFSPFTEVPTIAAACDLLLPIRDTARVGVIVDTWHFFHAGAAWDQLDTLPVEEIALVQLADGRMTDDVQPNETLHGRYLPGEGELDLASVAQRLRAARYTGVVSVEVLSAAERVRPVEEFAARAHRAALAFLAS